MKAEEFSRFNKQHCRFKMRSGKEVYGVIWESFGEGKPGFYFVSMGEFKRCNGFENSDAPKGLGFTIEIEDVITAEPID